TILAGGVITLSGQNATPVLVNNSNFATLSGLTITGASNPGINAEGGAIYNRRGKLVLESSTLSGNTAGFGGGIYNNDGQLYLSNCTISGNSASRGGGGGIYNTSGGQVTVQSSTLNNNLAYNSDSGPSDGGGIQNKSNRTLLPVRERPQPAYRKRWV